MSTFGGPLGTLRIVTDQIEVTSNLPRPDRNWRYTDAAGHEHRYDDGYPTLVRVGEGPYWCPDCHDEHEDSHWECPICHEEISPALTGPPPGREFIPGMTEYFLDGEPISKERAESILAEYQAAEQARKDAVRQAAVEALIAMGVDAAVADAAVQTLRGLGWKPPYGLPRRG